MRSYRTDAPSEKNDLSQVESSSPKLSADPSEDRLGKARLSLSHAQRLLVIRLRSLGDSILAIPLVEALHAWRPDLQIDMLVEAPYGALFARHPAVHETLVVKPRSGFVREGWSRLRACR
jgi:hypothetical protein